MDLSMLWAATLCLVLFPRINFAAPEKGTSIYTVEDLVAHSLAHSELLNAERARIAEMHEGAEQASAWANPTIAISGGAKKDLHDIGPAFHVSIAQEFSLGKLGLRRDVALVQQQLKEIEFAGAELAIIADVIRLAYDYALAKRKVQLAHARRSRFALLHSYLAGHTFPSPQQRAVSLAVKDRLRNLEVDEKQLEGNLKSVLAELTIYVANESFDAHSDIIVPWLNGTLRLNDEEWIARARANNLSLAHQRIEIDKASRETALLKRERWPDFSLSGFYNRETLGATEHTFGFGIGLSVPLWNRNQAALRSNSHKLVAEQQILSLRERELVVAVKKLLVEYDAARKIALAYPESAIMKLETELKNIESEFRKNRVDFLLFLDLDVQAAETANRILNAQRALLETISSLHVLCRDRNLPAAIARF